MVGNSLKIGSVTVVPLGNYIKKYVFDLDWEIKTEITASWGIGGSSEVGIGFFSQSLDIDAAGSSSTKQYRFAKNQPNVAIYVSE